MNDYKLDLEKYATLGSTALLAGYKRSERGIIARDVIDALPRFLYDLENAD